MESEELNALRDQVQRLNSALSQYQEKYPPLHAATEGAELPWLTDKNLMSPLLAEYDANLQTLREQNENYQSSHRELRLQVDKLVAENKRLGRELKSAVESQLADLPADTGGQTLDDDQLVANLQAQLQMALQEKDSAMEMWQAAVQEVERLEQETKNQHFNPRLETLEAHTHKIRTQYNRTVSELTTEVNTLQEELKKTKNELKASNIQVMDLRRTLEEMKNQLIRKEQEKTFVQDRREQAGSKAEGLTKSVADLNSRLQDTELHLSSAKKERASLEQKVIELQKKSTELEQREYEAVLQVKESVQMVENAMLEKDEALVRERQATEDVSRLQDAIAKLLDEAGARTRQEVDAVKKQCNDNISRLMEEIHALELENSEKQGQIDRSIREKRAVESELEKIYQEGLTQGSKESGTIDDLNRRACHAERLKDEAMIKIDSISGQLRRLEIKHTQEGKQHLAEIESLRERLEKLGLEFEGANNDRVRLMEEVDGLKKKTQALTQERDAGERKYKKEITLLEREGKRKTTDYETRLQAMEDGHRHAMLELRQLLSSQQRMSAKWKEECQTITAKFEAKVNDLRNEIGRHKKRGEEVTKMLRESRDKTIQAEQMIAEYARNIRRMEERVREAENRAATTSLQVSQQMARARAGLTNSQTGLMGSTKLTNGFNPLLACYELTSGGCDSPVYAADNFGCLLKEQQLIITLSLGELAEPITLQDLATDTQKSGVHFADSSHVSRDR